MKILVSYIALLSFMIIYSCRETVQDKIDYTNKLRTIEFSKFKLSVPGRWERFYLKDNDSVEVGISDGVDTIFIKYATLVPGLSHEKDENYHTNKQASVDGCRAKYTINNDGSEMEVFVESVSDSRSLYAKGISHKKSNDVAKILNSIDFPEVDGITSLDVVKDETGGYYFSGGDGKALFSANCASCHHPIKSSTGPDLRSAFQARKSEWVYKFLTDTKFKPKDNMSKSLIQQYGVQCMKFPNLSQMEINAIAKYVGAYKTRYID